MSGVRTPPPTSTLIIYLKKIFITYKELYLLNDLDFACINDKSARYPGSCTKNLVL